MTMDIKLSGPFQSPVPGSHHAPLNPVGPGFPPRRPPAPSPSQPIHVCLIRDCFAISPPVLLSTSIWGWEGGRAPPDLFLAHTTFPQGCGVSSPVPFPCLDAAGHAVPACHLVVTSGTCILPKSRPVPGKGLLCRLRLAEKCAGSSVPLAKVKSPGYATRGLRAAVGRDRGQKSVGGGAGGSDR